MLRRALWSVAAVGGAAFALLGLAAAGWVVAVAYGAADVSQAAELAAWVRARVELVTGVPATLAAARLGLPVAVAAAREWLASTVRGTVQEMLGK